MSATAGMDRAVASGSDDTAEIERRVTARLAEIGETQAFLWRFRLVGIETAMMGLLVAAAGITLHQPTGQVIRAAVTVAGACFASGLMLIGLSAATARGLARIRRWWTR